MKNYIPTLAALLCPLTFWYLAYVIDKPAWAVFFFPFWIGYVTYYFNGIFESKVYYKVVLSKLDSSRVVHEEVKTHATLTHTKQLRRLMRGKGQMTRLLWLKFLWRLRTQKFANHFPPSINGETLMFTVTYHREK